MASRKLVAQHQPVFLAALPRDPRVELSRLFGGVAAKVGGQTFAILIADSVAVWLPEAERAEALALPGAAPFDPMGRARKSEKVMLPASLMADPAGLAHWLARAYEATLSHRAGEPRPRPSPSSPAKRLRPRSATTRKR